MKYDVEILKKMIESETFNIKMFQSYFTIYEGYQNEEVKEYKIRLNEERIAEMVRDRRNLAALVENDGEPIEGINIDLMAYSATAGADTSWWTKGT